MANWGANNLERVRQMLEALRSARRGAESRGQQMVQGIGGVSQALGGGLGRLADRLHALGAEKRGYGHERGMAAEEAYQRSVERRAAEAEAGRGRRWQEEQGVLGREFEAGQARLDRESRERIAAMGRGDTPERIATVWRSALEDVIMLHPEMRDEMGNFVWQITSEEQADRLRKQFADAIRRYNLTAEQEQGLIASFEEYLEAPREPEPEPIPDEGKGILQRLQESFERFRALRKPIEEIDRVAEPDSGIPENDNAIDRARAMADLWGRTGRSITKEEMLERIDEMDAMSSTSLAQIRQQVAAGDEELTTEEALAVLYEIIVEMQEAGEEVRGAQSVREKVFPMGETQRLRLGPKEEDVIPTYEGVMRRFRQSLGR